MQSRLKILLFFLKCTKGILPIGAFACLVAWTLQFTNAIAYRQINKLIGAIPEIINKYIPVTSDINGTDVTMGYIYFALVLLALMVVISKIQKVLLRYVPQETNFSKMDFSTINIPQPTPTMPTKKDKVMLNTVLYGLIEINFSPNISSSSKMITFDLNQLKYQCTNMIADKLETKYPDIKFTKTDTIFFSTENYSQFNDILNDIKKLYGIVLNINKKNSINSDITASFHFTNKSQSIKTAYNILNKINKLNNHNCFIATENASILHSTIKNKSFNFIPIGKWELRNAGIANENISIDLYKAELLNNHF